MLIIHFSLPPPPDFLQDCHCTTGIYRLVPGVPGKLKVSTFCVHGSPKGRISGLQGEVTCADAAALRLLPEFETKLERSEGVVEKCVLRFPSLPFIPVSFMCLGPVGV